MNKDRILDELSVLQERFANGMGWRDGEYEEALDEAIELINQMPSADVVEVVRCIDCKKHNDLKYPDCLWTDDDFFCAGGERKETE